MSVPKTNLNSACSSSGYKILVLFGIMPLGLRSVGHSFSINVSDGERQLKCWTIGNKRINVVQKPRWKTKQVRDHPSILGHFFWNPSLPIFRQRNQRTPWLFASLLLALYYDLELVVPLYVFSFLLHVLYLRTTKFPSPILLFVSFSYDYPFSQSSEHFDALCNLKW